MNIIAFLFFLSGVLLIYAGYMFSMAGNSALAIMHTIGLFQIATGVMYVMVIYRGDQ